LGSYRSRLDIIADILHVAKDGAKKTQIMYQANLSYKLLKKYLADVIEACLVRFEKKEGYYIITSKGMNFLEVYKEYSRHNRHIEKQLKDMYIKKRTLENLCSNKKTSGKMIEVP